jgi:hypothetical protein
VSEATPLLARSTPAESLSTLTASSASCDGRHPRRYCWRLRFSSVVGCSGGIGSGSGF